jgi:glucose-6-phosphate dehydrogenase assembly protein OpcA
MSTATTATVAPDRILKELAALWTQEGKQGDAGVLRACSMTLIVMAESSDDAAAVTETMAALMPEHPARAILIRLQGAGKRALSERVYQQCWKPFGQRQQICCEQIEITASDEALADLPSVILPLAVADLPVILWCRSPRVTERPEFQQIAALACKVIVDSAAFPDPAAAVHRMADAVQRGIVLGDLAWTRLTRWRETLARVFENRDYLARLPEINSLRVEHGPDHEISAWYLAAWAANSLGPISHAISPVIGPQNASLRMELAGSSFRVELSRQEDRLMTVINDQSNCTHLPPPSDYLLMREELSRVGHDLIFEKALASAAQLAQSDSSETK